MNFECQQPLCLCAGRQLGAGTRQSSKEQALFFLLKTALSAKGLANSRFGARTGSEINRPKTKIFEFFGGYGMVQKKC